MNRWYELGVELSIPSRILQDISSTKLVIDSHFNPNLSGVHNESSMEKLLKYYCTDPSFIPNWPAVRDALIEIKESDLASEVYLGYILPNLTKKGNLYRSTIELLNDMVYLQFMQQQIRKYRILD